MSAELHFLGTSDSQGVPRWWCRCAVCQEAKTSGHNARRRPSVLLEGEDIILIDSAPELRLQLSAAAPPRLDAVLISHAHNDHIAGLGDLGDYAMRQRHPLHLFAPREVLPLLQARFPYLLRGGYPDYLHWHSLEDNPRRFAGYQLSAHRVPHGANGYAYAFRFDGSNGAWGYMSDCLDLLELEPWYGLDLLVLGSSFFRETKARHSRSVYDVHEALALLERLQPRRSLLTHLSHGVDVRQALPAHRLAHCAYARDSLKVALP